MRTDPVPLPRWHRYVGTNWSRVAAAVIAMVGLGCGAAAGREPVEPVDFDRQIRPLLADNCFQCHGPDARARKAKLRLDRREGLLGQVAPGRPEASPLLERIASSDPDHRMPPPGSGRSLTPAQIAQIRAWISRGASWTRHWALRPITRPAVPSATGLEIRSRNAIDRFVGVRLQQQGLRPSGPSDRGRLVRRVTLDLTGLPPFPETWTRR